MATVDFINILIEEYKIVQDQRNSSRPIVVTILGFTLATFVSYGAVNFPKSGEVPWYTAVAPLGLFLPASVALWNAQQEIFLSFYADAIEGKIRAELLKCVASPSDIELGSVRGLTLFSSSALLAESGSSRRKSGYGAVTLFCAAAVFSAAAIVMVWVGYFSVSKDPGMRWARLPYCIIYSFAAYLLIRYFYQVHIDSRRQFVVVVDKCQWRLSESAHLGTVGEKAYNRYYIPRPGDVVKCIWGVCGIVYYSMVHDYSTLLSVQSVVTYVVVFELVFYQTRYLVNDLVGIQEDLRHPAVRMRSRVPRDVNYVAALIKEVMLRGAIIALILVFIAWDFPLLSLHFSLSLAILILLTFGYEVIKRRESVSSSVFSATIMFPYVGLGYVLRFFTGVGTLVSIAGGLSVRHALEGFASVLFNPALLWNMRTVEAVGLSVMIVGLTMFSVSLGWLVEAVSWVVYDLNEKQLVVAVPSSSKSHIRVAICCYLNHIGVDRFKVEGVKGDVHAVSDSLPSLNAFVRHRKFATGCRPKRNADIWKCPWVWGDLVALTGVLLYMLARFSSVRTTWRFEVFCIFVVIVVAVLAFMSTCEVLSSRTSITFCGLFALFVLCGLFYYQAGVTFFVVSIYVFGLIVGMIIPMMRYESMVKGLSGFVSGLSSWFNDKSRSLAVKLVDRTS